MSDLRVLHVVATCQRRGGEIAAADLMGALERLGVEQRVVALRGGGLRFPAPSAVVGGGWRLPGIRIDPGVPRRLRSVVRDWGPHVLQAHGGEAFKHAVLAGSVPRAFRRIGWASPPARRGPRRLAHARLLRRADVLICVAEAVRRETIEVFGVPSERVVTIPNAVDEGRLRPRRGREATRELLGIPAEAPVLLSLGALVREKDPRTHLRVGERVRREVPGAIHLIAGDGPLRPVVEEEARRAGPRARVLGARADVGDLLAAADCLLLASRTEGMPSVLIEAGLAGVPAAAFDVAGVGEVVEDGVTGSLVTAGDVGRLSSAAAALLADGEARRAMGDVARDRCRARFEVSAVAPQYLDVYRRLVEG